jgi:hypothetical protein
MLLPFFLDIFLARKNFLLQSQANSAIVLGRLSQRGFPISYFDQRGHARYGFNRRDISAVCLIYSAT